MDEAKETNNCLKCPYNVTQYCESLGEYVHACTYISKVTAWACVEDEK